MDANSKKSFIDKMIARVFRRKKGRLDHVEVKKMKNKTEGQKRELSKKEKAIDENPWKKGELEPSFEPDLFLNPDLSQSSSEPNFVDIKSNELYDETPDVGKDKEKEKKKINFDFSFEANSSGHKKDENETVDDVLKTEKSKLSSDIELLNSSISDKKEDLDSNYFSVPENQKAEPNLLWAPSKGKISLENMDDFSNVFLEEKISSYFDYLLREDCYQFNQLTLQYKKHKDYCDHAVTYDDAAKASRDIERLLERIEELKKALERFKKIYYFDRSFEDDEQWITYLMNHYGEGVHGQFDVKVLENVKIYVNYQGMVKKLFELNQDTLKLQKNVSLKFCDIKDRDDKFDRFCQSFSFEKATFQKIKLSIRDYESVLNDLEDKIKNSTHVVRKVEYVSKKVNGHLIPLLIGYKMIKNRPEIPFAIKALAVTEITFAILEQMMGKTEKRFRKEVVVDDYEKEILEGLQSVDDVFERIDQTMEKVADFRKYFKDHFNGYDIPEYREALEQLDQLEDNIQEQKEYLFSTKNEFREQLETNWVKVKRLDYSSYDLDDHE